MARSPPRIHRLKEPGREKGDVPKPGGALAPGATPPSIRQVRLGSSGALGAGAAPRSRAGCSSQHVGGAIDTSARAVIKLPVWPLPEVQRTPRGSGVPFSIVQQVDGLLHKCQGVRVERDVLARSKDEAVCQNFGLNVGTV